VGRAIQFAGSASDPGRADDQELVYRWKFGDGTKDQGASVRHTYDRPGRYTVTLVAIDKDGARGEDNVQVEVSAASQQPAAVISGAAEAMVGEQLHFRGDRSSDPDGRIVDYTWDFGDGEAASGVEVSHRYQADGRYRVTLVVTDDDGLKNQMSHEVRVRPTPPPNQPPTAVISGPLDAAPAQLLAYNAHASSDPDGQIVDFAWDMGDGTAASGADVTHSYTQTGTYTVTLVARDDSGLSSRVAQLVSVQQRDPANLPPVAAISMATNPGGATVHLDGSRSSDPDGQIVSYGWDFGDGVVGRGITTTHVYSQAGRYVATLTVTDATGLRARTGQVLAIE
jgi:PKD repeat protein